MNTPIATLDEFADIEHFLCTAPEIQFQQCAERCRQLIAQPKGRKKSLSRVDDPTIPTPPNMDELIATGNRTLALARVRTYQQKVRGTLNCRIVDERAKLQDKEIQAKARFEKDRTGRERGKKACCIAM